MQSKKILIAQNDCNDSAAILNNMFAERGHRVTHVDNGDSVCRLISGDHYDLLVTELNLPRVSGIDLIQKVKQNDASIPVIVVSEHADVANAVEAMKRGASDFLLKPLTTETVETICSYIPNGSLPKESAKQNGKHRIITRNNEMQRLLQLSKDIAESQAAVFIQGESGTGKELIARYIHSCSDRKASPFIAINCAALPETLLESELFGHEKGAFTGAINKKKGKFEIAEDGTLLLDEVSEMNYPLQSKLLRVLQEKEIDRIGGTAPISVNARIIATTNRNVDQHIKENRFREDLYYRLSVIPIHLPPLRDRREDIPILVEHFVQKYNRIDGRSVKGLTEAAMDVLIRRPWKGNVRELENMIERAVLLAKENVIDERTLFITDPSPVVQDLQYRSLPDCSLREVEKNMILKTLDKTNGNRTHAAEILGISVRTLRNKLKEYRKKMEIQ
jgi:DNA-binding NtrC family response regulator